MFTQSFLEIIITRRLDKSEFQVPGISAILLFKSTVLLFIIAKWTSRFNDQKKKASESHLLLHDTYQISRDLADCRKILISFLYK